MEKLTLTWRQGISVGESLKWCDRKLKPDELRNNFSKTRCERKNEFVVRAKTLFITNLMKLEVLDQVEHYFWEAKWYTLEAVESLAGNLNVVREGSEGIYWQLQTVLWLCIALLQMWWCGSLRWGTGVWGTFVSLCAFSRKCLYGAMCGCTVV